MSQARDSVQVVILAAGKGTRLGRPLPKPLTKLSDERTILAQQTANIRAAFGSAVPLTIVVGYKKELIMEAEPDAVFVYNENYEETNTNRSLLKALRASAPGGVLWLNGDVVFDPALFDLLREHVDADRSVIAVNTAVVGEEEVKYTVDANDLVSTLSKQVLDGLGEAVGINYISSGDKGPLMRRLAECGDQDYFERGIELAIEHDSIAIIAVDISAVFAVEVDFEEDLDRANRARDA